MADNSQSSLAILNEDSNLSVLELLRTKSSAVRQGSCSLYRVQSLFEACKHKLYKSDRLIYEARIATLIKRKARLTKSTRTHRGAVPRSIHSWLFRRATDRLHRDMLRKSAQVAGEGSRTSAGSSKSSETTVLPSRTLSTRPASTASIYLTNQDGASRRYLPASTIVESVLEVSQVAEFPSSRDPDTESGYSQESPEPEGIPTPRNSRSSGWWKWHVGHGKVAAHTTPRLNISSPSPLSQAVDKACPRCVEQVTTMEGSSSGHRQRPSEDITLVSDDTFLRRKVSTKSQQPPRVSPPRSDHAGLKSILENSSEEHADGDYEKRGSVGDSGVSKRAWASAVAKGKRRETSGE